MDKLFLFFLCSPFFLSAQLGPTNSQAQKLNTHGYGIYKEGRYKEALEYFESAIRAAPRYALPHYNQASSLLRLGLLQTVDYKKIYRELAWSLLLDAEAGSSRTWDKLDTDKDLKDLRKNNKQIYKLLKSFDRRLSLSLAGKTFYSVLSNKQIIEIKFQGQQYIWTHIQNNTSAGTLSVNDQPLFRVYGYYYTQNNMIIMLSELGAEQVPMKFSEHMSRNSSIFMFYQPDTKEIHGIMNSPKASYSLYLAEFSKLRTK